MRCEEWLVVNQLKGVQVCLWVCVSARTWEWGWWRHQHVQRWGAWYDCEKWKKGHGAGWGQRERPQEATERAWDLVPQPVMSFTSCLGRNSQICSAGAFYSSRSVESELVEEGEHGQTWQEPAASGLEQRGAEAGQGRVVLAAQTRWWGWRCPGFCRRAAGRLNEVQRMAGARGCGVMA